MDTYIVGVDCATKYAKVGLAKAIIQNNTCRIIEAQCCTVAESPALIIARWHRETPISLLALDAPLGWPASMGAALVNHTAGNYISVEPDDLFHRKTDEEIRNRLSKRPLEVGANLIARTAKSALDLLDELRHTTDEDIPLVWKMGVAQQLSAIEVYPAATWLSLNPSTDNASIQKFDRSQIIQKISQMVDTTNVKDDITSSAHVLDAVLCVIGAFEFIAGRCIEPQDLKLAQKEGWIWAGGKRK